MAFRRAAMAHTAVQMKSLMRRSYARETCQTHSTFPCCNERRTRRAFTVYAKVESLHSWFGATGDGGGADPDTFVVALINPEQARSELNLMRYVQAEEGPG